MAVSNGSRLRSQRGRLQRIGSQLSRYDLVLAVIPFSFMLALVVAAVVSIPLHASMGASALFSSVLLADALYLNPPTAGVSDQ